MMKNRDVWVFKFRPLNKNKALHLDNQLRIYNQAICEGIEHVQHLGVLRSGEVHKLVYPLARQKGLSSHFARHVVNEVDHIVRRAKREKRENQFRPLGLDIPAQAYELVQKGQTWHIGLLFSKADKRLWLPLENHERLAVYLSRAKGAARLFRHHGVWFIKLSFPTPHSPIVSQEPPFTQVTGIDLGVVRLVSVSTGNHFWCVRGVHFQKRRQRFALQRQKAHRSLRIKNIRQAEKRWMCDINHKVSRMVVTHAVKAGSTHLALENLDGILYHRSRSYRFDHMCAAWDFQQLIKMIVYKAHAQGLAVIFVNPRGTSTTCLRCHLTDSRNASSNGQFHCKGCCYQTISDAVAARNLALRGAEEARARAPP